MTDLSGVYMRAPETWPFKTPTIPSKLVPSHKTYAPNNEGLVFVDPRDIATLLGLGFYLYGQSPDVNALLAGLPGAGDPSMFLAMDGVGRTPGGGGGGSSGLMPLVTVEIADPTNAIVFSLSNQTAMGFLIETVGIELNPDDNILLQTSEDDGISYFGESSDPDYSYMMPESFFQTDPGTITVTSSTFLERLLVGVILTPL